MGVRGSRLLLMRIPCKSFRQAYYQRLAVMRNNHSLSPIIHSLIDSRLTVRSLPFPCHLVYRSFNSCSPPAYYFRPGSGSGQSSWLVYLQGGGWCTTAAQCASRAKTYLGSSRLWPDPSNPQFGKQVGTIMMSCGQDGFNGSKPRPRCLRTETITCNDPRFLESLSIDA